MSVSEAIDIIIPTYKPDKRFLQLLDSLLAQTVKVRRILIVNTEKRYWDSLMQDVAFEAKYPMAEVVHISGRE